MIITENNDGIPTLVFDGPFEAAEFAKNTPRAKGAYSESAMHGRDRTWALGMSLEKTLDNVTSGYVWQEGLDKLMSGMEITDELAARSELPRIQRHMAGGAPCVPAYAMGHPKAMYRRAKAPAVDKPVLRVGLSMGLVWSTKAEQRLNLGAAMLSSVDALEHAGYRCEIVAVWRAANHNDCANPDEWANIETVIKRPQDRWNPAQLAFMIAHPAATRRLYWRILETQDKWVALTRSGYLDNTNTTQYHRFMSSDFDIYFENMMPNTVSKCRTPEGAFKLVEETIAKQLAEAKEAAQ